MVQTESYNGVTMTDWDSSGVLVPPPIVYLVCLMVSLGRMTLCPLPPPMLFVKLLKDLQ